MIATADSRVNKRSWEKTNKETKIVDKLFPVFPNNVKRRCPAIIFADKRIARVPGRITFLIVSIRTINGINTKGVPCGTMCANICFVLFNQPNNIKLIHKGNAKESVKVMWLVLVKM